MQADCAPARPLPLFLGRYSSTLHRDHCLAMFTKLPNTAACTSSQGIDVSLRGVAHSAPASVPGARRPHR